MGDRYYIFPLLPVSTERTGVWWGFERWRSKFGGWQNSEI